MLGGAPKNGKSWMVLDWCVRVAKGEPVWNLPVKQGSTLYLCLEDPLRRVQGCVLSQPSKQWAEADYRFIFLCLAR